MKRSLLLILAIHVLSGIFLSAYAQPANFAGNATGTTINLSWTAGTTLPAQDGFVIIGRQQAPSTSFPTLPPTGPLDEDLDFADGQVLHAVSLATLSYSFLNAIAGKGYDFEIYGYKISGPNLEYTTATATTVYTLATSPGAQPGGFTFTATATSSQINLAFTAASAWSAGGYVLVRKAAATPSLTPTDGTAPTAATDYLATITSSATSYPDVTAVPGTTYTYALIPFNVGLNVSSNPVTQTYNYGTADNINPSATVVIQATIAQQTGGVSGTIAGGDADRALIGFNFTTNAAQTITGATFTFSVAPATLGISGLELWESNTAAYDGSSGSVVASGANVNVAGSVVTVSSFAAASNKYYFLRGDISLAATANNFNIEFTTATVSAGTITNAAPYFTKSGIVLNALTAAISQETGGVSGALVAGDLGKALVGFSFTSTGSQDITGGTFTFGTDPSTLQLSNIVLFESNTATYTGAGTIIASTGNAKLSIAATVVTVSSINAVTGKYYFLLADVSSTAPAATFTVQFTSATVSQGSITTPAPYFTKSGITISALTGSIAQETGGVSNTMTGSDTGKALLGFSLTTNGLQNITGGTFTFSTAPATLQLTNIVLFESNTATYTGAGTTIASTGNAKLSIASNVVTVTGITAVAGKYYFLVTDVAASATPATFNVQFTSSTVSGGTITTSAPYFSHTNIAIVGLTATFAEITAGTSPVISATQLIAGETAQVLTGFSATSNGVQTLSSINFNISGLTNEFTTVSLYRSLVVGSVGSLILADVNTDGNFDDLSSVSAGNKTLSVTPTYYYLVVNVKNDLVQSPAIVTVNPNQTHVVLAGGAKNSFTINRSFTFSQSLSSDISFVSSSDQANINITGTIVHQNALTSGNSVRLATFRIRDGGGVADTDNFGTTLNNLSITLANSGNLERVAVFAGTTNVQELSAGSTLNFTALALVAADDGTADFSIRASFKQIVTDNQSISVQIVATTNALTSGSLFASPTAGGAQTVQANQTEIVATRLVFVDPSNLPPVNPIFTGTINANISPQTGSIFSATVAAVDANNNIDLDNTASVTLNISPSASVTFTGGGASALSGGLHTYSTLTINKADTYSLGATGGGLIAASSGNSTACTVVIQSLGISITSPGNLSVCQVGDEDFYTTLPDIIMTETDPADFGAGTNLTFLLILPQGWEFDVTATPTMTATPGNNFNTPATFSSYLGATQAKFTYSVTGTNNTDVVTISGFRVKNVEGITGIITRGGVGIIQGCCDDSKVLGTLTSSAPGTADFTVEASPGEASISADQTSFPQFSASIILNGESPDNTPVTTGSFTGPGVTQKTFGAPINGNRYTFNPSVLNAGDYDVVYTNNDGVTGCISTVTKTLTVYSSAYSGIQSVYCGNVSTPQSVSVNPAVVPANGDVVLEGGKEVFAMRIPSALYITKVVINPSSITVTVNNHGFNNGEQYDMFIGYGFTGVDSPYGYVYGTYTISNVTTNTFDVPVTVGGAWDKSYGYVYVRLPYAYIDVTAVVNNGTSLTITTMTDHGLKAGARPYLYISGLTVGGYQLEGYFAVKNVTPYTFDIDVAATGSFTYGLNYGYVNIIWYRTTTVIPDLTLLNSKLEGINTFELSYFIQYDWYPSPNFGYNFYFTSNPENIGLYDLPNADFVGLEASYCEGGTIVQINAANTGQPDGTFTAVPATGLSDGNYTALFNPASYGAFLDQEISITYSITDTRGCSNSSSQKTIVKSKPVVDAGLNQTICNGNATALGGSPTASSFSATKFQYDWNNTGTLNDGSSSNPLASPTSNTTYTVTVTDEFGCIATDNTQVTVNAPATVDAGPASAEVCAGQIFNLNSLTGKAFSGAPGANWSVSFGTQPGEFLNASDAPATSFAAATQYNPADADDIAGAVIIRLTTDDPDGTPGFGCDAVYDEVKISINPIPAAPNLVPNDIRYCVNDFINDLSAGGSNIRWYDEFGVLKFNGSVYGTGINNTIDRRYTFYATQTEKNCESPQAMATITVNPLPTADFTRDIFCLGDATIFDASPSSLVYGNNLVGSTGQIDGWEWSFDDGDALRVGSGAIPSGTHGGRTAGTYDMPTHTYAAIGTYDVDLRVYTNDLRQGTGANDGLGCSNTVTKTLKIGQKPLPEFNYRFICDGDDTEFVARTENNPVIPNADIQSYQWSFDNTLPANANIVTHDFGGVGKYDVQLTITTNLGCVGIINKQVPILPYIKNLNITPYTEDFEVDNGWAPQAVITEPGNEGLHSWILKQPNEQVIISSNQAWITHVDAINTYYNRERSVLNGPCVDFTGLERPLLSFDFWNSTDGGNDGVFIQTSINEGETWQTLGDESSGLMWYNDNSILGLTELPGAPGVGQPVGQIGWSGTATEWMNARYNLDPFKDATKVRFRFVFGSNPDNPDVSVTPRDGFALDNFRIVSRNRTVLVENFTSTSETENNNDYQDFKSTLTSDEIVKIEYHTSLKNEDPINLENKADPNARVAFYGLTNSANSIPRAVLDGETRGSFLGPLESGKLWTENEFNTQTLIDAPFAIVVSTLDTDEGMIEVQASVTSKIANLDTSPLRIFFLLVEKEVEMDNVMFTNVVRKILPSAAGYPLPSSMTVDLPVTITGPELSWVVNNANINPENLAVVAFIQNLENHKVYQTAIDENPANLPTVVTGIENPAFAKRILVYPNPSNEEVNIVLPEVSKSSTPVRLTDSFGREITASSFKAGQQSKILATKELSAGVYFIQIKTDKGIAVKKLVVAH